MATRRIGILTGGGHVPGLNSVIKYVVYRSADQGIEVTGIHGWFWQNKGKKDVQFHLTVAGFFDSAKMLAGGPPEDVPVEDAK